MAPPDGTLRAAGRWLQLLSRSPFPQAAALIRADAAYSDLTQTQYAAAIDWLKTVGLVDLTDQGLVIAGQVGQRAKESPGAVLFAAALEQDAPPWLPDSDTLVQDADELPSDAAGLAETLGITGDEALLAVRLIHGRIDLAERARVGAVGECALVALLEETWPHSTRHVSLSDDGLGYDVEFTCGGNTWHLEIKSTTRRGRLAIHLSRHEHNVAELDPAWRLVAVGLDESDQVAAVATADTSLLLARAPRDHDMNTRWDSVRHLLSPDDLSAGLSFLSLAQTITAPACLTQYGDEPSRFAWLPGPTSSEMGLGSR